MSSSSIREGLLAYTIFTPVAEGNPVVSSQRNCSGGLVGTDAPVKIAQGHYRTFSPDAFIGKQVSITKHATDAAGDNRLVSVVLALVGTTTQIDIFIADDAAAPTDDALFVECTIERLPL